MNSTRSARAKANQINYAELLADETELTELDDDDVSPDRAGPSTTTHTRAQTRGNKRKDVTTVSSTGKLGGTSTKAKRGKRKAVDEKSSKPKDEDVDMDTKDTTRGGGGKYNINRLLASTASPLVNLDMHDIINAQTWSSLSQAAQERLCQLLPPTAFYGFTETLDETYNEASSTRNGFNLTKSSTTTEPNDDSMDVDQSQIPSTMTNTDSNNKSLEILDLSVFTDPHFDSAIQTFQDHLYSGYHTRTHHDLVDKHVNSVRQGRLHVPWKDETWLVEHPAVSDDDDSDESYNEGDEKKRNRRGKRERQPTTDEQKQNKKKGDDIRIQNLVRAGAVKVGDMLSIKHHFEPQGLVFEKDCIIHSFTKSGDVTIITYDGPDPPEGLPAALLSLGYHYTPPPNPFVPLAASRTSRSTLADSTTSHTTYPLTSLPANIISYTFTSPKKLDTYLLSLDPRAPKGAKLGTPWKSTTVWRWPSGWAGAVGGGGDEGDVDEDAVKVEIAQGVYGKRGGREVRGTLHYLRGVMIEQK